MLSADQVLDNITLYWLTGTGASSARLYWESIAQVTGWFTTATSDTIAVPAACSVFPKEVPRPSRRWAERRFANIVYWNEPGRGGHFAAWEQPSLFTREVRAVARSCRDLQYDTGRLLYQGCSRESRNATGVSRACASLLPRGMSTDQIGIL